MTSSGWRTPTQKFMSMNNPWTTAYNHPAFEGYTQEQIDEMTFGELQEILSYD